MEKSHKIWNKRNPNDKVKKGEIIHHKNENRKDDSVGNQQKMLFGKHNSLHKMGNKNCLGMKHTEETKRKMSLAKKGNKNWLGKKHTEKTKRKMRESHAKRKENANC